jgi:citrate lyase beta subunit
LGTREQLQYKVGALMYTPALNKNIAAKISGEGIADLDSLCLCLEDAITPVGVNEAEIQLAQTLKRISACSGADKPLLFVRVRGPEQLKRLPQILGEYIQVLTGAVLPKFDLSNAAEYCSILGNINARLKKPLFIMPILESRDIISFESRWRSLTGLRKLLDGCRDAVLNIRVGAMDFCNFYGLRREINQSVYDIGVIANTLTDILTVFADAYAVSAPVWEYFAGGGNDDAWQRGLERELEMDIANGFTGKTAIHPSQLPLIRKWLKPSAADYADAQAILNWRGGHLGVAKSCGGNRMNELAAHQKWARKIICFADAYGIR